jgi:hypothetical protein
LLGIGASAALAGVAHAATTMDLNQHGLTGNWYDPTTSGQGISIEIYPDQVATGNGTLFGGWFTFDRAPAGGADRNRWYTVTGSTIAGRASSGLTIYVNEGGNFDAPPVTKGTVVGTAIFLADSCDSAFLQYDFTDGSGRTGTIEMQRLTPNVTCSTTAARPVDADFAHSGNWFAETTSGQGFIFEVNPVAKVFFATWYTYAPDGSSIGGGPSQRWYTAQASYTPGARSFPLTVYETTGGVFANSTPATTVAVGTATLDFASCTAATFTYAFTGGTNAGLSGSMPLTRIGPVPAGCA